MIKYNKQKNCGIKIVQLPLDTFKQLHNIPKESENTCTLFWAEDHKDIQFCFYSNTKTIQALEFMDYLVQDYVIVQGDAKKAQAILTSAFLQAMILDFEVETISQLIEKITELYFVKCDSIYTKDFAEKNHDMILNMPRYVKKKITWAYVKTTDIMNIGEQFYLKSIENESQLLLEASEDLYIMSRRNLSYQ